METLILLSYVISCCLCLSSGFAGIPLDISLNQEDVNIQILGSTYNGRRKRSSPLFPTTLSLRITKGEQNISLKLLKNSALTTGIPLTIERQGKIIHQNIKQTQMVSFYQDSAALASFAVTSDRNANDTRSAPNFSYFGSFYHGSNHYLLQQSDVHKGRYTASKTTRPTSFDEDIIQLVQPDLREKAETLTREYRHKRSNKQLNEIEVLVVADYSVYEFWLEQTTSSSPVERDIEAKKNSQQYYAFVMNGADMRFQSIRDRNFTIRIIFSAIHVVDCPNDDPLNDAKQASVGGTTRIQINNNSGLSSFLKWIRDRTKFLTPHDDAVLFTKLDLTMLKDGQFINGVAGSGYPGGICFGTAQALVEDNFNAEISGIVAHEIGHNLGAVHDEDEICDKKEYSYVMSSHITDLRFSGPLIRRQWRFSNCSADQFGQFIDSLNRNDYNCMTKRSHKGKLDMHANQLPGQIYSPDIQCKNTYGENSALATELYNGNLTSICTRMYCTYPETEYVNWLVYIIMAWEGTYCGKGKICRKGNCVSENSLDTGKNTELPTKDKMQENVIDTCISTVINSMLHNQPGC